MKHKGFHFQTKKFCIVDVADMQSLTKSLAGMLGRLFFIDDLKWHVTQVRFIYKIKSLCKYDLN